MTITASGRKEKCGVIGIAAPLLGSVASGAILVYTSGVSTLTLASGSSSLASGVPVRATDGYLVKNANASPDTIQFWIGDVDLSMAKTYLEKYRFTIIEAGDVKAVSNPRARDSVNTRKLNMNCVDGAGICSVIIDKL